MGATLRLSARRGELAGALALLALALAVLVLSWKMPFGSAAQPGPGAFPFGLGSLLLLVSIGLTGRALRVAGPDDEAMIEIGHRHIWTGLAALTVFALVFEPLGYLIGTTLFMLTLLRAWAQLSWQRSFLAGLLAALLSWLFFERLLGVNLPPGILRALLGGD